MDPITRLYVNERAELPNQFDFMQVERANRCICDTYLLDWCHTDTNSKLLKVHYGIRVH